MIMVNVTSNPMYLELAIFSFGRSGMELIIRSSKNAKISESMLREISNHYANVLQLSGDKKSKLYGPLPYVNDILVLIYGFHAIDLTVKDPRLIDHVTYAEFLVFYSANLDPSITRIKEEINQLLSDFTAALKENNIRLVKQEDVNLLQEMFLSAIQKDLDSQFSTSPTENIIVARNIEYLNYVSNRYNKQLNVCFLTLQNKLAVTIKNILFKAVDNYGLIKYVNLNTNEINFDYPRLKVAIITTDSPRLVDLKRFNALIVFCSLDTTILSIIPDYLKNTLETLNVSTIFSLFYYPNEYSLLFDFLRDKSYNNRSILLYKLAQDNLNLADAMTNFCNTFILNYLKIQV